MATHDYDIANQSGAAFRTDLNNALAAIQSNNSNSSSPATTVAYQWWADTTSGTLKIRNSANNAWVELFQLDGTLTLEDGSASTPALSFRDDLDTGVFSSSANTFCVATAGTIRMELGTTSTIFNDDGADVDFRIEGDADPNLLYLKADNDHIGIGTNNPLNKVHIQGGGLHITDATVPSIRLVAADNSNGSNNNRAFFGIATSSNNFMNGTAANDTCIVYSEGGDLKIGTGSAVKAILDSNGRVLLGTTVEGHENADDLTVAGSGNSGITIRSGTSNFGQIFFSDGTSGDTEYRGIVGYDHSDNHMKFHTDTTERLRLDSSGRTLIGSGAIATPKATAGGLDVSANNLSIVFGGDSNSGSDTTARTNNTLKDQRIAAAHYANAEEPVGVVRVLSQSAANDVYFCGGSSLFNAATSIFFYTASDNTTSTGSQRMQIDSAGRVSIGTTANAAHFQVYVNAASRVPIDVNDTNNTSTLTHRIRFLTGGTEVGRIRSSNSATSYDTSASDITLKKNFEDWTENTLDLFKNINPQKFHFIQEEDTAEKSKGFIAQEMVDSFPEAYTKEDKKDSKYYFNPSGMVVYLMKAIQELEAKVAALEAA